MEIVLQTLGALWLYGGSYFAALATASSFYAVFFFFWTRTGKRKGKESKEAKELYLYPIYWILRFSLGMIVIFKLIELFMLMNFAEIQGLTVSLADIIFSANGAMIYMLIVILAINSAAMVKNVINFTYALPLAITSYFFLFLHQTTVNNLNIGGYFTPADEHTMISVLIYVIMVGVVTIVFNYFSKKVR